jgi:hypothetical protein
MMQKTLHELLTGTNTQINIQLIEENVPTAVNQLQQLIKARQLAQSHLKHIQKTKDNKTPQLFIERQQVWLEGKNLSIKGSRKLSPKLVLQRLVAIDSLAESQSWLVNSWM